MNTDGKWKGDAMTFQGRTYHGKELNHARHAESVLIRGGTFRIEPPMNWDTGHDGMNASFREHAAGRNRLAGAVINRGGLQRAACR